CMLCRQAEADQDICGPILNQEGVCAHFFCLFFANEISPQMDEEQEELIFDAEEIERAVEHAAQRECCVCHQSGATITCSETGCDVSFHLPCATQDGCATQYFGLHRSFCREHPPRQAVEAVPEEAPPCLICMDPVDNQTSYRTMVCPACQHAWFHRECLQGQALHAGLMRFQCPAYAPSQAAAVASSSQALLVPSRNLMVSETSSHTETPSGDLGSSPVHATGRASSNRAEQDGPWQLLLCSSCAAEGTHRRCSHLRPRTNSWECSSCA
ncbi:PHD finger protein 7, partial [Dryobates pubescens]